MSRHAAHSCAKPVSGSEQITITESIKETHGQTAVVIKQYGPRVT
jgi:hypothetical protein